MIWRPWALTMPRWPGRDQPKHFYIPICVYKILRTLKTLETSNCKEKELGETGLWLMSYCTKNGEIS